MQSSRSPMDQPFFGMRTLLDSVSQKLHPVYDQLRELFRLEDEMDMAGASPRRSATFLRQQNHRPANDGPLRNSWPMSIINRIYTSDDTAANRPDTPVSSLTSSAAEQRRQTRLNIRENTASARAAAEQQQQQQGGGGGGGGGRGSRRQSGVTGSARSQRSQSMPRPSFLFPKEEQESQSAGSSPIAIVRHSYAGETIAENVQEAGEPAPDTAAKASSRENLGKIQFSLTYDFHDMALNLKIIRAEELVAKDYSGTSDPYVKILLLPDKKSKVQTSVKRKNLNPKWNEAFTFEGFPYNKLLTKTLCLQVFDYDRFSRDDPIGEVFLPLCDVDLTVTQILWKPLQHPKSDTGKLGELQCSLRYMPSSCKIYVGVNEARYLRPKDINGYSDPYVKIWLLNDNKKVEKRRTKVIHKDLNPHFDETFEFDVPYERIRQTSLLVSVLDHDYLSKNEIIGSLLLGPKSGVLEQKHWNEMFSRSRQSVVFWHQLKDLTITVDQ